MHIVHSKSFLKMDFSKSNSLRKWGPLILHCTAILHYFFAEYYYSNHMELPDHGPYRIFSVAGGRYKFLTVWNMMFQSIFFWICLVNDLFGTNEADPVRRPFCRKLRDFLHASIGFPLSMLVGTTFWTLWTIDRDLVFPKPLDLYFPTWLNHSMHTTTMVYTLLHSFMCFNLYPSRSAGVLTLLGVVAVYISWIFAVHISSGMWTYPIFQILSWPERFFFLGISVVFLIGWYFIGEFFNNFIWGGAAQYHLQVLCNGKSKSGKNTTTAAIQSESY